MSMSIPGDLGDDGDDEELQNIRDHKHIPDSNQLQQLKLRAGPSRPTATTQDDGSSSNVNGKGFSMVLSCYPYAQTATCPSLQLY
jgi:hypothetical protein